PARHAQGGFAGSRSSTKEFEVAWRLDSKELASETCVSESKDVSSRQAHTPSLRLLLTELSKTGENPTARPLQGRGSCRLFNCSTVGTRRMLGVRVEDVNGICQKKGKATYRLPHGSCFEGPEALGTAIPAVALALGAFSDYSSDYPGWTPARNIRVFN